MHRHLFKLSDKLHSSVWLRNCHLNSLWGFNTWDLVPGDSGQRLASADQGQPSTGYCQQLPVCCSPLCSKHWSTREVMLSAVLFEPDGSTICLSLGGVCETLWNSLLTFSDVPSTHWKEEKEMS